MKCLLTLSSMNFTLNLLVINIKEAYICRIFITPLKLKNMKKSLLSAFGVALLLLATSCKKDYTCTCTVLGVSNDTPLNDYTKSDAKEACDKSSSSAAILGGSCTLK